MLVHFIDLLTIQDNDLGRKKSKEIFKNSEKHK